MPGAFNWLSLFGQLNEAEVLSLMICFEHKFGFTEGCEVYGGC